MHSNYASTSIRKLRDRLVHGEPDTRKFDQVGRMERLLTELDPKRTYSFEHLSKRISAPVDGDDGDVTLTGEQASHDLRLLVEDVSDAANVPADAAGERVVTIDELSKQLKVSTKTIARWRKQGLVSRRFVFDGRKRVGFLASSVERFVRDNEEQVRRGMHFSQMSDEERAMILRRARRLAMAGGTLPEVIKRLARKTRRSLETIRYTVKQHDRAHPEAAIFRDFNGPLSEEARQRIYQQFRRGESLEAISRRVRRSKAAVKRIIDQVRAAKVLGLPLDYIPNPQFPHIRSKRAVREICGPMPGLTKQGAKVRLPKGLPPYLASLYEVPLLDRQQEAHLFRKLNYVKYKACRLRQRLDPDCPQVSLMDRIERLYGEAVATKNEIIRANLRLVVAIAKRHVGPMEDFFDLVSDGNMSLIRAAEKFDFAQGNKFSTYATWAIMRNFARTIPNERRHHDRFRPSPTEVLSSSRDERSDQYELETAQSQRQNQVGKILGYLDQREQEIIVRRFGLAAGQEPLTLKEVGAVMGVTKERVRQLEARAMTKLRKAAADEKIEMPELIY
jgi:RNA polymerase primary sigma factor/RNA polymerase sigma factor